MEQEDSIDQEAYNETITIKLRKEAKYQKFKEWLLQNGAIIDERIEYPAAFGVNGYVGVSCNEPIQAFRAVVAIPRQLIIDANRVRSMPEFSSIMKENPRMFSSQHHRDGAFHLLTLYLIVQRLKGQASFFHPYFQASESNNLLLHWTKHDLQQLQNRDLMDDVLAFKEDSQTEFMNFLRVIRKYDKVFPQEITNQAYKKLFEWAYEFVMTRAFGWSVPAASLIPFADSFNHGHSYLQHFFVDVQRQKEEAVESSYIRKKKKCNLNIFKKEHLVPSAEDFKKFREPQKTYRQKYIESHRKILEQTKGKDLPTEKAINRITHQQYSSGVHKLRQLVFGESSCSEDNDTDEEDLASYAYQCQKLKIENKGILKGSNKTGLNKSIQSYWKLYEEEKMKPTKPSGRHDIKQRDIKQQRQRIVQEFSNEPEEQEQSEEEEQEPYPLSENSKQSEISEASEQNEEQFDWLDDSKPNPVYFVMHTKNPCRRHDQLYNFYGRRSNRFLLLGYNFAMIDNKYDSFTFRLIVQPLSCSKPVVTKLIFNKQMNIKSSKGLVLTKPIKVKRQKICIELIDHCRCLVMSHQFKDSLATPIPILVPTDKNIEQQAINLSKDILRYQLEHYQSDIETDEEILVNKATPLRLFTAVTIRMSHKQILKEQIRLLDRCLDFLARWKKGKIQLQQKQMTEVSRVREYLYELERSQL